MNNTNGTPQNGGTSGVSRRVTMVGNFGLRTKGTMVARALPLARALIDRGGVVSLCMPPWDSPPDAGKVDIVDGVPVSYTRVPPKWPIVAHGLLALDLFRLAWRDMPDVLYAFKPKAYSGAVMMLFLLARRVGLFRGRVVLDSDDWEGDGGWNDRESFRFNWFARKLISWHEKWCLRHADLVTVSSRALEPLAARAGARSIVYLPICVDTDLAPRPDAAVVSRLRDSLGLTSARVVLAYTRLAEFAPSRLVSTFASIASRCPDARLLVVGRGLHGEEEQLTAAVREQGLEGRVVQAGWVEQRDVPAYLALADVALQLLDDNLLTRTKGQAKLLEMLALGVPVVADAVGQANDYIVQCRTGVLVSPGDSGAMADAAVDLLNDDDRRLAMGTAAAIDSRERWSWVAWNNELMSVMSTTDSPPTTAGGERE